MLKGGFVRFRRNFSIHRNYTLLFAEKESIGNPRNILFCTELIWRVRRNLGDFYFCFYLTEAVLNGITRVLPLPVGIPG